MKAEHRPKQNVTGAIKPREKSNREEVMGAIKPREKSNREEKITNNS